MDNIVNLPTAAISPQTLIETLLKDAGRMSAVVVMIKMEDGSWHLRHSTMTTSTLDLASMQLLKQAVHMVAT